MTPQRKLFEAWLTKAGHDLIVARLCADNNPPLFDEAAYHCQQAAEKSIKGLLTLSDIEFSKIHDITKLLQLAIPVNSEFQKYLPQGDMLTKFATITRYPDEQEGITQKEFDSAFAAANAIFDTTRSL